MEFIVNERPCLVLETAELVYALINHIPAEQLTCDMPYAIPAHEIQRMLNTVCADLDPADEELRFYFQGVHVVDMNKRLSCLACTLLYCSMCVEHYEVEDMIQALKVSWHKMTTPFKITGIGAFSFSFDISETYTTLSREIRKLPIPQHYQMDLVEVFANFDYHADRLCQLLTPLAERLEPLLEPWVRNAAPRRAEWRVFLRQDDAEAILLRKSNVTDHIFSKVCMVMRYLSPMSAPGEYQLLSGLMTYHMGVALPPGKDAPEKSKPLEDHDYTVLRLLSNPDRIAMLNAMMFEPMNGPALMQKLKLHSGSVFRDLNNMYHAGLLIITAQDGKHAYRTNFSAIHKLTRRMLHAINPCFEE